MKTLWFKAQFVQEILAGAKRDTIRPESARLPLVGETIALSVGPRKPFARAVVTRRARVDRSRLTRSRHDQVSECYGELPENSIRLWFRLL